MTIVPHWLEKRAFLTPDDTAIQLIDRTTISFKELLDDAISFAEQVHHLGVEKGDHVSLLSNNSYDMVVAIHALSFLQAKIVLFNTRLTPSELLFQFDDSECTFCIYEEGLEEKMVEINSVGKGQAYSFTAIKEAELKSFPIPKEMDLDEIFTIIYTSGTTGFPKGVLQTYGNHFWSATASALNLGLHQEDRWLATLPLFHVSGLSILVKSVLYGMPVHLHPRFEMKEVEREIFEEKVTMISVVTVLLEQLIRELGDKTFPPSLRCILLGGGPAPKPLLEACKDKNIPVFQSYGMTETSSQIVTLSDRDALVKIGSAGKALFPAQLKIVQGNIEAKPFDVGEIMVKGPMVTGGYYKRDEANSDAFQAGWLHTGDLGYVDQEGFLFVMDRRKDLIISGGENVYPAEIESAIKEMDDVLDAGVVGIEDEKWGQVPVAFIVKKDLSSLNVEMVSIFLQKRLAKYKIPENFYFVEELPRNASNKLLRRTLSGWMKEGRFKTSH